MDNIISILNDTFNSGIMKLNATYWLMTWITIGFLIGIFFRVVDSNVLLILEQFNYFVFKGFYYELITSIFVTGSVSDYVFNIIAMYFVYLLFRSKVGRIEYIVFLVSGIIGNILTLYFFPPLTLSSGASGGIFGLISFYVVLEMLEEKKVDFYGIMFIVLTFFFSDLLPDANYWAHIGGIIGGIIMAPLVYHFLRKQNDQSKLL